MRSLSYEPNWDDTIYLLRIEKIGIPLFLLKGHYNPFFTKAKNFSFYCYCIFALQPPID